MLHLNRLLSRSKVFLCALALGGTINACSDDAATEPDARVDSMKVRKDSAPSPDQSTPDLQVDHGPICTPNERRCAASGNAIEACDAKGMLFSIVTDCDALALPVATFTCEACPAGAGHGARATCKASRILFSGKVSGDLTSLDYAYEGACDPLVVKAAFTAGGGFEHLVEPQGDTDGAYPILQLTVPDLSQAPSGQFLPFSAGAGQTPAVLVTYDIGPGGPGTSCKNVAPTGAGTPPKAGTATLTYAKTQKGETMSIVIDGWLTCDAGTSWKQFKYTASGIAF